MNLSVAFLPVLSSGWKNRICIVIDVLQASSSIVTFLENGAEAVHPVHAVEAARKLAADRGLLLFGERGGLPLPGFDGGNSALELRDLDLHGKRLVMTTTNGTAALEQVAGDNTVLVGCARNCTACVTAALALSARNGADLGIVCAGFSGRFALDDAVCAGLLVDTACRLAGAQWCLSDAAAAARTLYRTSGGLQDAFERSASGRRVREIGHGGDLAVCARIDASRTVPQITHHQPLTIRAQGHETPGPERAPKKTTQV